MGYGDQVSKFNLAYGIVVDYENIGDSFKYFPGVERVNFHPFASQPRAFNQSDSEMEMHIQTFINLQIYIEENFEEFGLKVNGYIKNLEGSPGEKTRFFIYIGNDTNLEGEDLGSYVDIDIEKLTTISQEQLNIMMKIGEIFNARPSWKSFVGNY